MVVRRETRQGKTAFMKRLQAFHVGDRPRLMMEHHTFLARERSTDADFTTAELAIVATERPAAPLAPEAPTVVAAARCGSKNIGWIRQEAVDAKEEAVDQAWRLGDEKQDDEEEDRDDEEWYKEDDFDAPISANAEVKGKAADSDCDEDEDAMPFDEVLLDVDSDDPTEMLAESEPADEDADNETTAGMLEFAKNEPELAKIRKKGWHLDPNTFPPDQHYSGLYDVDYALVHIPKGNSMMKEFRSVVTKGYKNLTNVQRYQLFAMRTANPGVMTCRVGPVAVGVDQVLRRTFDGIRTDAAKLRNLLDSHLEPLQLPAPNFEKKQQMHNKVKPFVPHQYASVPIYAAPTDEEERMANEAKQARRKASAQKNKKCH
ncbi:hypothetical protein PC110_g20270 [Phytophthora cactorum]|uniref:Uncharacterized protein n=1 Tax=Phytophthora cactorum TaxID=29920 RepID=A0A329RF87_9STRA|nr:hypothetical protein PC110_g20270 [Phytophthora cactorum]